LCVGKISAVLRMYSFNRGNFRFCLF